MYEMSVFDIVAKDSYVLQNKFQYYKIIIKANNSTSDNFGSYIYE